MLVAVVLVVFPFCMLFAALSDMLSMTIANRVSALLFVTFFLVAPFTGMDMAAIGNHLAAFAIVLAVTFSLFAFGAMGGGDAKLLASTSLWMGLGLPLLEYLISSAVLGGLLTVAILSFRASSLAVFSTENRFLKNFTSQAKGVPYGIALGIGGLLAYPSSPLMVWATAQMVAG